MNSHNAIQGAVALLVAAFGTSAIAGPAPEYPPIQVVGYADLNLSSPAGVARLYRRIGNAADRVCDFPADPHQLGEVRRSKACRAHALESAVVQAGIPGLQALHLAKTARHSRPRQLANNQ